MKKTIELMNEKRNEQMKSLFDGDEVYEEQNETAMKLELIETTRNFLTIKPVKACYNCGWRNELEKCTVMTKFNQDIIFPTLDFEKCKHWKKRKTDI